MAVATPRRCLPRVLRRSRALPARLLSSSGDTSDAISSGYWMPYDGPDVGVPPAHRCPVCVTPHVSPAGRGLVSAPVRVAFHAPADECQEEHLPGGTVSPVYRSRHAGRDGAVRGCAGAGQSHGGGPDGEPQLRQLRVVRRELRCRCRRPQYQPQLLPRGWWRTVQLRAGAVRRRLGTARVPGRHAVPVTLHAEPVVRRVGVGAVVRGGERLSGFPGSRCCHGVWWRGPRAHVERGGKRWTRLDATTEQRPRADTGSSRRSTGVAPRRRANPAPSGIGVSF